MSAPSADSVTQKPTLNRLRLRATPEEEAVMRERLIIARVMNGFSLDDARARLGDEYTNIASIEAGKRRFPRCHHFVYRAAKAYSVSADFLFGLSPNPDMDAVYSERFALMRGFEDVLKRQAQATSTAFFNYAASQTKLSRAQHEAIVNAVDAIRRTICVMREKYGFDDIPGGASLLSAIQSAEASIKPIRKALAAQIEIEALCRDYALGKIGPISYLLDEKNEIFLEP